MFLTLRRVGLPAAALLLAAAGCSSATGTSSSAPTTTSSSSAAPTPTTSPASPAAPAPTTASTPPGSASSTAAAQIVIDNFAFSPAALTVHPGQTVTVVNHDSTTHTLTSSGGKFDTGPLTPGQSATFTAPATAGVYPYVCSIHASMHGTLTVG